MMHCHVYRSSHKDGMYLYVAGEASADEAHMDRLLEALPEQLMQLFGRPEKVMELELTAERKLAREDVAQVIGQLQEKGYYLQMPPADPMLIERQMGEV